MLKSLVTIFCISNINYILPTKARLDIFLNMRFTMLKKAIFLLLKGIRNYVRQYILFKVQDDIFKHIYYEHLLVCIECHPQTGYG